MLKATKGHKVLIVALVLISIFATSLFVPEVSAVRTKQRQGRHEKDQAALLFDNFVRKHKKVYKDEAERTFRLGVFRKNLENLNYMKENSDQDVQYGITKFFDMSETEFKTKVLMRKQPNAVHPWKGSIPLKGKMEDVPSSWVSLETTTTTTTTTNAPIHSANQLVHPCLLFLLLTGLSLLVSKDWREHGAVTSVKVRCIYIYVYI